MKYIIIQTWNGEGYSYTNKAEVKEFATTVDALSHIMDLMKGESYVAANILTSREEGCIAYVTENEDAGTYQYKRLNDGDYGVVITCNINEYRVLNKADFEVELNAAMEDADEDEIEVDGENVFIPAGEYDFVFSKLKP